MKSILWLGVFKMFNRLINNSKILICSVFILLGKCFGSEDLNNELSEEAFTAFATDHNSELCKTFEKLLHRNKCKGNKYFNHETQLESIREVVKDTLSKLTNASGILGKSCDSDWKQATVKLALSDVLYGAGENDAIISNLRKRALCKIIKGRGDLSKIEKHVRITSYLRYINNVIKKGNDIFGFSGNPCHYQAFWKSSYDGLQKSLDELKQRSNEKTDIYELAIKEISFFKDRGLEK